MMHRRRFLQSLILIGGLFALAVPSSLAASPPSALTVRLVAAGNSGESSRSLGSLEKHLRRVFRFSSYRQVASRKMRLDGTGAGSVSLGSGQTVEVRAAGNGTRFAVHWRRGKKTLIRSTVPIRRERPAILGGPREGEETLILIISAGK